MSYHGHADDTSKAKGRRGAGEDASGRLGIVETERQIRSHRMMAPVSRRGFLAGAGMLALGLVATGSLAACGGTGETGAATADSSKKVLRFAQANMKMTLDEHVTNDANSYTLGDLVGESPCMWTEDNEEVPCLLTKMPEVSADGLTYTLTLKDTIPCHDGSKLTANDVKFSINRMLWPETKYKSLPMINMIEGAKDVIAGTTRDCTGVTVVDDTHVTIKLTQPYAPFTGIMGTSFFVIYPQSAVEAAGDQWGKGTNLIGSGPFKLTSNDDASALVFERFEDYHGTPAKIDELDIAYIDDNNTKMLNYVNGDLDLCDVAPALLKQYMNDDKVKDQLHEYNPMASYFIDYNLSKDNLKDVRVRQAISLAINRQELVDTVLSGAGEAASEYLSPKFPAHDPSLPVLAYDPEQAKSLLAQAGVASGLTIECGVKSSEKDVAVAIQGYLEKVGITLNVETLDSGVYSDRWRQGELETTILSWNSRFPDGELALATFFQSDIAKNVGSFYNSPQFDALLAQARAEQDADKRNDLYRQADHLLCLEDWACCPLYYPKRYFAEKPYVTGMKIGATLFHFRDVDIDMSKKDA